MHNSLFVYVKSIQPPDLTHSWCKLEQLLQKRLLSHLPLHVTEHGRCTTESLAPEKETSALAKQPKPFCPQHFVSLQSHACTFALPPLLCTKADFKGLENLKSCCSTSARATRKLLSKCPARTFYSCWMNRKLKGKWEDKCGCFLSTKPMGGQWKDWWICKKWTVWVLRITETGEKVNYQGVVTCVAKALLVW